MSNLDIAVPDIATLARRRSEKWASAEPGVLAMTVAEMDFPPAPPVSAVLREALDRGDEIHAPLTLPGAEFVPWLEVSPAARERGFVLTSASKAFNLAGLKAAHIVTAAGAAADVVRGLPPIGHAAGHFGVLASEAAFEAGEEWLNTAVAFLERGRVALGSGPRYGSAGFVRLNFGTSPELVREGVRRMAAVLPVPTESTAARAAWR